MRRSTFVLSVLLFLTAAPAFADIPAGTPRFSWTAPTQNTDGSAIPATGPASLKEYRIYCDAATAPIKVINHPTLVWQSALGDFSSGAHSCRATAVSVAGDESAKTNPVNFTLPVQPPTVPGSWSVQ